MCVDNWVFCVYNQVHLWYISHDHHIYRCIALTMCVHVCVCADSIATKRFDAQTGADREVQRILLELLNQMDGFDQQTNVKVRYLFTVCFQLILCF